MQKKVTFVVYPNYELLDLSGPASAFHLVNELYNARYAINVVSAHGGIVVDRSGLGMQTNCLAVAEEGETILAVGGPTAHLNEFDDSIITHLAEATRHAKRVGSVCTGAFLLAAAGLLDNRAATTHWRYAGILQAQYPKIEVVPNRIFVQHHNVWTSAGMTAGIDLALAMIEEDFDFNTAKGVARDLVVHHRRLGGQSQFSAMLEMEPKSGRIKTVLSYVRDHLTEDLSINRLAEIACLSPRQFSRIFFQSTGNTPSKAIELLKLEVARAGVEDGVDPLQKIANDAGFGSAERMRRSFWSVFGRTPQEMRQAARRRLQEHAE